LKNGTSVETFAKFSNMINYKKEGGNNMKNKIQILIIIAILLSISGCINREEKSLVDTNTGLVQANAESAKSLIQTPED
jgi:hypothetical protein